MESNRDDKINIEIFSKLIDEENYRSKNKIAIDINDMGDVYLREIENKKILKKKTIIEQILINPKNHIPEFTLITYSIGELEDHLNSITTKSSKFKTFIKFLFNL